MKTIDQGGRPAYSVEEDVRANRATGGMIFLNFFFCALQMTEQRKQKQRIGLLGHPQHMNANPQQPA